MLSSNSLDNQHSLVQHLESAGASGGLIRPDQRQLLPSLIEALWGRAPKTASTSPIYTVTHSTASSAATLAPDAPANAAPVLAPREGGSSICGDGLPVAKRDAIFEFPKQPTVSCSTLENAGATVSFQLTSAHCSLTRLWIHASATQRQVRHLRFLRARHRLLRLHARLRTRPLSLLQWRRRKEDVLCVEMV